MEGIKDRIDAALNAKSLLEYLSKRGTDEGFKVCDRNDVLVYRTKYFLEICKEFVELPVIVELDDKSDSQTEITHKAFIYYRNMEFFTYLHGDREAAAMETEIEKLDLEFQLAAELKRIDDEQAEDDDNV